MAVAPASVAAPKDGLAAMVGAVLLFSALAAVVATTAVGGLAAICLVSLGSGVALVAYVLARGDDRSRVPAGPFVALTLLNLAQIGLYYLALRLAPAGPAAALHLATPVMLMAHAVLTGSRRFAGREAVVLALLLAGLGLCAATSTGPSEHTTAETFAGLALALASSVAMAAFLLCIFANAQRMSLQWCNALKGIAGGLVFAPTLLVDPPPLGPALEVLAAGVLLGAPGLALAWYALARVQPSVTSTIDLLEAVFTPAFAAALFAVSFSWALLAGMVPVLAAAYLEIRRPPASG